MDPQDSSIRLIVGLGNVGAEYERTRHNAGFWFVDAVARKAGVRFGAERKFQILPAQILVAHDEVDLPPGTAKLKRGGGTAGHNGLKDIQARLSTPEFWRLRIGVGHPRTLALTQEVADFVLHPPGREHEAAIDEAIDRALQIVPALLDGQFERAMMKLHPTPKTP